MLPISSVSSVSSVNQINEEISRIPFISSKAIDCFKKVFVNTSFECFEKLERKITSLKESIIALNEVEQQEKFLKVFGIICSALLVTLAVSTAAVFIFIESIDVAVAIPAVAVAFLCYALMSSLFYAEYYKNDGNFSALDLLCSLVIGPLLAATYGFTIKKRTVQQILETKKQVDTDLAKTVEAFNHNYSQWKESLEKEVVHLSTSEISGIKSFREDMQVALQNLEDFKSYLST